MNYFYMSCLEVNHFLLSKLINMDKRQNCLIHQTRSAINNKVILDKGSGRDI